MNQDINYINLCNNWWQNVINKDGYKNLYAVVYFSIADSCNRNNWNNTPISIDLNLAKTRVSKKVFYESIIWLKTNNLIKYEPGKNEYSMAKYKIVAVHKVTSTRTTTDTTDYTTTDTTALPQVIPNNKQETLNIKHKTKNISEFDKQIRTTCRNLFLDIYKTKNQSEYYWTPKDATNMNQLIDKIKFKVKEKFPEVEKNEPDYSEKIISSMHHILNGIKDQWIQDNFCYPIINSKFNEIYTQIKLNPNGNKHPKEAEHKRILDNALKFINNDSGSPKLVQPS